MPDLTGQSIGRYHILEPLGEGGMATVYKAYDTRLERNVAFKVLRTDLFGSAIIEQILKRFEREAKSLAKLKHLNIVNILDFGEHEGSPYLVMEYLPGGTLKQKLGHVVPWQDAIHILLPVARGLAYAHQHGVIHRDVKPANILIDQNDEPILTDFGIAKLLEGTEGHTLTGSGVGIGTPEYMAPEQGIGAHTIDARADIYSLGIVLYEMVTGRKPYIADTPMAVVLKQMTDPLPRPSDFVPDLPDGVENILLKALAKQPEDRYSDMNALILAMESVLGEAHKIETPVPTKQVKERAARHIRPSPKVVMVVLGAFGAIAIIVMGIMAIPKISDYFSPVPTNTLSSIAIRTTLPTPISTTYPTRTQPPTLPIAPTDKPAFYKNILTYIETSRPSFEDDFSTAKTEWGQVWNSGGVGVWKWRNLTDVYRQDYSMRVNNEIILPLTSLLAAGDFVISADWALVSTDSLEFIFRSSSDELTCYKFIYHKGGTWDLIRKDGAKSTQLQSGRFKPKVGSEKSYDPDKGDRWSQIPLNNFQFIAHKENLAIFINGKLTLEFHELASYGDKWFFRVSGRGPSKMDNFKFWRLSEVDFNQ